jgi:ethanolamine-phosphate cytidylyltransferase
MADQQSSSEKRSVDSDTQGRSSTKQKKLIKVWTDGCFDMMHFGHANALRQVSRG